MARWEPSPDFPLRVCAGADQATRRPVDCHPVPGERAGRAEDEKDEARDFQPELIVEAADGGTGSGAGAFKQRPLNRDTATPKRWPSTCSIAATSSLRSGTTWPCVRPLPRLHRPRPAHPHRHRTGLRSPADHACLLWTSSPASANLTLDMKVLAGVSNGNFGERLMPLVAASGEWIDGLRARIEDPAPDIALSSQPRSSKPAARSCRLRPGWRYRTAGKP